MWSALLEYQFLQNALWAGLLSSLVCGIIGVIIVEKKLVMMSGGIAHTAYGGVGLGYLLGFEPIIGAFIFAVAAALGIGAIKRQTTSGSDVVIALFWSMGMALGILFISLMPGYPPDLSSYLFGSILAVSRLDLILMMILSLIVVAIVVTFFNHWKAYLFDEEFAGIIGLKINVLENVLLVLIAITIVVLIRVVGIILVIALLTAPAAIAAMFTDRLWKRMVYAVLLGVFFSLSGIWLSYEMNIASGAAIVIISGLSYFSVYFAQKIKKQSLGKEK